MKIAYLGQFWHFNVHWCTNGCSQVGWAEGEETKTIVMWEWDTLFNVIDSGHQTAVYFAQIATLLHGNDTQVIFLVAPNQEGFVVIVIDTTTSWPEAAASGKDNTVTISMMKMYEMYYKEPKLMFQIKILRLDAYQALAACKKRSPSLNKKWSSINCCWTAFSMPVNG